MNKNHFVYNIISILLFFILLSSNVIYSDARSVYSVFKCYGLENGLSQMTVYAIAQDSMGFMWFGTQDGLNRFDGYQFKAFKNDPDKKDSIINSFITALFVDKAGKLWIGSRGGLSQYNPATEKFHNFKYSIYTDKSHSNYTILSIDQDSEGKLWLGTDGNGIYCFDPDKKIFQHFPSNSKASSDRGINVIRKLLFADEEKLWVGTHGAGLKLFNKDNRSFEPFVNKLDTDKNRAGLRIIQSIYKDEEGRLWLGTEAGLSVIKDPISKIHTNNEPPEIDFGFSGLIIHTILEYKKNVWFGTNKGLFRFIRNKKKLIHYKNDPQDPYSLSNNSIHTLFLDRSEILWIGTDSGGICQLNLDNLKFKIFRHNKNEHGSSKNNLIRGLFHSKRSGLYVGTFGSGFDRYNPFSEKLKHYIFQKNSLNSISNNNVTAITEDQNGFIWIGTVYGLNRFDPQNETFTHYFYNDQDSESLSNNLIRTLCVDSKNELWVATSGGGLNHFKSETNNFIRYLNIPGDINSLSENNIWSLIAVENGDLWIGTDGNGVNLFNSKKGNFTRYTKDSCGLSHNSIFCIYWESDERIWIGTFGGGLNLLNPKTGTVKRYNENDGLANNVVYGILKDDQGNLWMSTNKGISRLNPKNNTFKNFDVKNGLQSNEFNQGAFCQAENGEMFFGGLSGYISFYPEQFKKDLSLPEIYLTDFRLFNETVPIKTGNINGLLKQSIISTDVIELTYKESLISFEFSALEFKNPDKLKYAYLLDGWDKNWIETDSDRRIATYTKLKPGNYIFKVKARNSDGVWNPKTKDIKIIVLPPIWMTWWAYMIYVMSFFGLMYFWKLQQQKRAKILRKMVDQRTQELFLSNKKLENLSITDGLTGLGNRRYLTKFIENETKLLNREYIGLQNHDGPTAAKKTLLFLLMDLDLFKQVNDTYGHNAGDMVLKQIKNIMEKNSRESDVLIRWGGEEFLIIYRNIQSSSGEQIAENLRLAIEKHPFKIGEDRIIYKTASLGFAEYPFFTKYPTKLSWEDIINLADKALYASKNSGRNSWTGYKEPENIEDIPDDYLEKILHDPTKLAEDEKLTIFYSKTYRSK